MARKWVVKLTDAQVSALFRAAAFRDEELLEELHAPAGFGRQIAGERRALLGALEAMHESGWRPKEIR